MNEEQAPVRINVTKDHHHHHGGGSGNVIYGLGFIGAAIYYIGQATSFWPGVLGFLKAIVWPVFLVMEALAKLAG